MTDSLVYYIIIQAYQTIKCISIRKMLSDTLYSSKCKFWIRNIHIIYCNKYCYYRNVDGAWTAHYELVRIKVYSHGVITQWLFNKCVVKDGFTAHMVQYLTVPNRHCPSYQLHQSEEPHWRSPADAQSGSWSHQTTVLATDTYFRPCTVQCRNQSVDQS